MQALWMVLAALIFAVMSVCVKFASQDFNAAEIVFYRGLVSMALLVWLARRSGVTLTTQYSREHAWRSFVGVISMGAWFYAIGHLPLATATTLNSMSSIWMAVFLIAQGLWMRHTLRPMRPSPKPAAPFRPSPGAWCPRAGGLCRRVAGAAPDQRPGQRMFAALGGLFGGMFAAMAYMQVTTLSRLGEPETRVVFYFSVGWPLPAASPCCSPHLALPGWSALWLLPVGVLAAVAQVCMTKAYASAGSKSNTLVVANLQYSGIVFAALLSLVLFGESIPLIGWGGIVLIVASGAAATALRSRG
jgi:drug/metabolite transporter (DMT)-like permease